MKRLYNCALGLSRKDDTLPERILTQARGTGDSADTLPNLEKQLDDYYAYRKWTKDGFPTAEVIADLDLDEFSSWS